jgi:hypothetical protein
MKARVLGEGVAQRAAAITHLTGYGFHASAAARSTTPTPVGLGKINERCWSLSAITARASSRLPLAPRTRGLELPRARPQA